MDNKKRLALERLMVLGDSMDRMSTQQRKATYALASGDVRRALYEIRGVSIEHNANALTISMILEYLGDKDLEGEVVEAAPKIKSDGPAQKEESDAG